MKKGFFIDNILLVSAIFKIHLDHFLQFYTFFLIRLLSQTRVFGSGLFSFSKKVEFIVEIWSMWPFVV